MLTVQKEVFNESELTHGRCIKVKLKNSRNNEDKHYGIIQSCNIDRIDYFRINKDSISIEEKTIFISNLYKYEIELLPSLEDW